MTLHDAPQIRIEIRHLPFRRSSRTFALRRQLRGHHRGGVFKEKGREVPMLAWLHRKQSHRRACPPASAASKAPGYRCSAFGRVHPPHQQPPQRHCTLGDSRHLGLFLSVLHSSRSHQPEVKIPSQGREVHSRSRRDCCLLFFSDSSSTTTPSTPSSNSNPGCIHFCRFCT